MTRVAIRSPSERTLACRPLAGVGSALPRTAGRFRRWRGLSGRNYVVSVYPIDHCPDYVDAVLIAVADHGRRIVWVGDSRSAGDQLALTLGRAALAGADEVHLH